MVTIGECLRNNWNSINGSQGKERATRVRLQNHFANTGEFDVEFYLKYLWNNEVEE